ncbi:MAG: amidohydrolase [Clostridia bacterium]|nr:amidohydrolase [Clostridia bacterium]
MDLSNLTIDRELMVRVRRELHMHPERGWDLDNTTAVVRRELDLIGIPYEFEKYGRNTIVATINPDITSFTIGIRADMDALPIEEADHGQPYRSQNPGVMHACGHDAHTAMLVGTCKALWAIRDQIRCRVRFIFQPSEEARPSGARVMCENGVMDDIDCIIMCHVNCVDPVHVISTNNTATNSSSVAFFITLGGKSVHIATPHAGIDALSAGVKVYNGIQTLVSREVDPFDTCVMSVAVMHAGNTVAANADNCRLEGSIRCLKDETMVWARQRLEKLVRCVAEETGVTWELSWSGEPLPSAHNDPAMYEAFISSARKAIGADKVIWLPTSPGAEDFAYYEKKKPGLLFGLGMRNEDKGACYPAHTKNWDIDEDGLPTGVKAFAQFVLDHMDGISGMKMPKGE